MMNRRADGENGSTAKSPAQDAVIGRFTVTSCLSCQIRFCFLKQTLNFVTVSQHADRSEDQIWQTCVSLKHNKFCFNQSDRHAKCSLCFFHRIYVGLWICFCIKSKRNHFTRSSFMMCCRRNMVLKPSSLNIHAQEICMWRFISQCCFNILTSILGPGTNTAAVRKVKLIKTSLRGPGRGQVRGPAGAPFGPAL